MSEPRRASRHRVFALFLFVSCLVPGFPYPGIAQVPTNITSSGLNTQVGAPVTLPNGQIIHDITGGTRPGSGPNLFHSFGELNVGGGHIANFLNDSGLATNNILGRVTGGNPSNIFGTLQTTGFGNANLFLINPAGIVFGPTASLNVGGSVNVSTANYVRLADGARFNAVPGPSDALLSVAPVAAFGFLGNSAAAIAVRGSTLTVAEGKTLSLVGGNSGFIDATGTAVPDGVSVTNGSLIAPGGQINIVSVGKPNTPSHGGEVALNTGAATGFSSMGDVVIARNTPDLAEVAAQDGGKIVIRGGQIQTENYRIVADGGGSIAIEGTTLAISNTGIPCNGCGFGEGVRVGSNSGTVTITGTKSVALNNALIGGSLDPFAVVPTGPVTIKAPTVSVTGTSFRLGGSLASRGRLDVLGQNIAFTGSNITKGENFSPVDVNILAEKSVSLSQVDMQQLYSAGDQMGSSVHIEGKKVQMTDVNINTSHIFGGAGDAGNIQIKARDTVTLVDTQLTSNSGGLPSTSASSVGDAGAIVISAGKDVNVRGSTVSAQTMSSGNAGEIIIGAGHNTTLDQSSLSANSNSTTTGFPGVGAAGTILVGAGKNLKVKESNVSADSQGAANAGFIGMAAGNNVRVEQSSLSAQGLGGGADGFIVLGAGNHVTLKNSTVAPTPLIFEKP